MSIDNPLKVRLESNQHGVGKIIIDGKDYSSYTTGFKLFVGVGEMTRLNVTFSNIEVEVDLEEALMKKEGINVLS